MKTESFHPSTRAHAIVRRAIRLGLAVAFAAWAPVTAHAQAQAQVQAAQALLHEYKCYICHADTEAKAGPAYVDVAARYRGKREAVTTIAAIVRKGAHGDGLWHMPPHPEVSDADARTMARYILSLGK